MKNYIYLSFLIFFVSCNGCGSSFGSLISIEELNEASHQYALDEETVEIIGEVTARTLIPEVTSYLNEIRGYTISDGSGWIIVQPRNYVPRSGEYVKVTGTLKQVVAAGISGYNGDLFAVSEEELEVLDINDYCDLKDEIIGVEDDCWDDEY